LIADDLDESIWLVTPDKSRYRTSAVLELQMSGKGVYQASGFTCELPAPSKVDFNRRGTSHFKQTQNLMQVAANRVICLASSHASVVLIGGPAKLRDHNSTNEGKAMNDQARNYFNRELTESDGTPVQPAGAVSGELVTETFEYDGGRQVTVYVPPNPTEAIVFAGDGQRIAQWGRLVPKADARTTIPPTMIVGAHGLADDMPRLHEYSPGFDPDRFAAHERFFVEDVRRWTQARFGVALPSERTAVFGASAGGELALALGLRHPDVYGTVFCASPGAGYKPPRLMPSPLPRAYLVAGTQEPFFLANAKRWANALRDAGADVVMNERAGSHGGIFWQEEFPLMVAWAFGR
jgi:enterochelin esterase-like enzyme